MTPASRMPTWKERENNKRRERRRRAIAANIFTGLRTYGNYNLPKHCDNNEVLKALCYDAGWTVEPDGTTYRKGSKPAERINLNGRSTSVSPCSSYHPSPVTSYNPSPTSSTFPSPGSSSYAGHVNGDGNSLIPWLKNLSSGSSAKFHHLYHGGSISAPVTPPMSSPTCGTPRTAGWSGPNYPHLPLSTPPSPVHETQPGSVWFSGMQTPPSGPTSPTFSLVSSSPFGFKIPSFGSHMCTPGQSGTCSPAIPGGCDHTGDIPMAEVISDEFAFGSIKGGLVKAWEGERIHEESGSDELELTLGNSRTR